MRGECHKSEKIVQKSRNNILKYFREVIDFFWKLVSIFGKFVHISGKLVHILILGLGTRFQNFETNFEKFGGIMATGGLK